MIITTQRHPFNHWLDRLLTLAGWLIFSYLLIQGGWILVSHFSNASAFEKIDPFFPTLWSFFFYGVLLMINALLLLVWWQWHRRQAQKQQLRKSLELQRLRASQERSSSLLAFPDEHIDAIRHSQVVVVYHSPDGAVQEVKVAASVKNSMPLVFPIPLRVSNSEVGISQAALTQ